MFMMAYKNLILAVTFVFFQAGTLESTECQLTHCRSSRCNDYRCTRCKDGHYLDNTTNTSRDYCHACPYICSACDGYEDCSACNAGRYGYLCQSSCTYGCKNNFCDKNSGSCTDGCINDYYQQVDGTCSQCPTRCSQCSSSFSCSKCKNVSYWGAACQHTCNFCSNCLKDYGCFYGCTAGYYRNYNQNKAGYECTQCPETCTSCTGSNNCDSCRGNFWGSACQYTCDHCSSCSKSDGCSSGCNNGYYMRYSNTRKGYVCDWCIATCTPVCKSGYWGNTCQKSCPNSCDACSSDTACSSCALGSWGSYCQHSCFACSGGICDKSQGCMYGCISGYYNEMISPNEHHCKKCLEACRTCETSDSCSSCNSGFTGPQCQYDCRNCNGQICDFSTGVCTHECAPDEYFKMDYSGMGCFECPDGCSRCSSATQCTECVTGKWGSACKIDCPNNCYNNTCLKYNGYCSPSGCVDGFYGEKCTSKCLSICKTCSNSSSCTTCEAGLFNGQTYQKCECSTNKCSRIEENICQECSDSTWYPESNGCCPCSSKCINKKCSTDGSCINCINGKYGTNCDIDCSTICKDRQCYRNGSCISCNNGWRYGPTCGSHCYNGIRNCYTCYGLRSDSLVCTRCYNGRYPDVNGKHCIACSTNCKAGSSPTCEPSTGSCKNGCEMGWYGEKCDINCNVTNCQTCSKEDPNICMECDDGFFSETNFSCYVCPSKCLTNTICDKQNGSCSGGCDENWSGEQCDIPCPSGCKTCNQFNKSSCSLCKNDFYGNTCENTCNTGCVTKNQSQTCDKSSGNCNFGCKKGFWDNNCGEQCGNGCSGNLCNRTTGNCLSSCLETHFGQMCDNHCNENCVNTTGRSCNEIDGYCLYGCAVGWFGKQCNDECGQNCKKSICDRNNASCTYGCIDGYSGFMCSQALQKDDPNTAAIGGGAGAGVAVLVILVVIVVVVVLRRRKTSSKMETMKRQPVEKNYSLRQTEPAGPEYSNINEARNYTPRQKFSIIAFQKSNINV